MAQSSGAFMRPIGFKFWVMLYMGSDEDFL